MTVTKEQIVASIKVVAAVAEAIRELKSVPSGHLYARLAATGMSLQSYHNVIDTLKRAGLVTSYNHLLEWVG